MSNRKKGKMRETEKTTWGRRVKKIFGIDRKEKNNEKNNMRRSRKEAERESLSVQQLVTKRNGFTEVWNYKLGKEITF